MGKLTKTISFNDWITQFRKEKSDRGIFARWFVDREGISYAKTRPISKKSFLLVMGRENTSRFLRDVFEESWNDFLIIPNAIIIRNYKIKMVIPRI